MNKKLFADYSGLEQYLQREIRNSTGALAILGGHYALNSKVEASIAPDTPGSFGIFPLYTFELACRLIKFGKSSGKSPQLVLLVDDHSQMPDKQWYMGKETAAGEIRRKVESYFQTFSPPSEYTAIMQYYSLSETDLLASTRGWGWQESYYREKFAQATGLDPGCAGEYRLILEELAQQEIKKLIAFIPLRCQRPVCNAVGQYNAVKSNPLLKTTHIFLSSNEENFTLEDLLEEMKEKYGGIIVMKECSSRLLRKD